MLARATMLNRAATRQFHSIARPAADAIASESPVTVYEAKEWADLKQCSNSGAFDNRLMASEHRGKVFSLLPFFVEAGFTKKSFVLQMEFYPKAQMLKMDVLRMDGVHSQFVPMTNVIPITRYDYWAASWKFWTKQNQLLDLDMVYANRISKEMYLFDKSGEWHEEGVYHEGLSMEKTYNESNWYDEFSVHNL